MLSEMSVVAAKTVGKECSGVGFGSVGGPGGDHSCLSNLIEGLDGFTRRGLGSRSSGERAAADWEQLIDAGTDTGDIRWRREVSRASERSGGVRERGREKRKIATEGVLLAVFECGRILT